MQDSEKKRIKEIIAAAESQNLSIQLIDWEPMKILENRKDVLWQALQEIKQIVS